MNVLIIGGGIIALTTARELIKRGIRNITILEKDTVGSGASCAAAGMLASDAESNGVGRFYELCSASNKLFPSLAEDLFTETGVDIELDLTGTLFVAFTDDDEAEVDERFEIQKRAGINVQMLSAEDIRRIEPGISPTVRKGVLYGDNGQVENRKLVAALRKYAEINGVVIREHTCAEELLADGVNVTGARSEKERFYADRVIIATGAWPHLIQTVRLICDIDVKPIRGQMIGFEPGRSSFRHVIYSPRGYIVPRADRHIISGSTMEDAGFRPEVTPDGISSMRAAACEIATILENTAMNESWAGLRPFVSDGLPVIGKVPGHENAFAAFGHFRNGILLSPITGHIMADLVTKGSTDIDIEPFGFGRSAFAAKNVSN